MANQRQKAPALLANTRGGRGRGMQVVAHAGAGPPMPTPPAGVAEWNEPAITIWDAFWESKIAGAVDVHADAAQLSRWVEAIHRRAELIAKVDKEGWTGPWGAKGQDVEHPALSFVRHLDREIDRFAEHFGLTPLSRFRLQITFTEAKEGEDRLTRLLERRAAEKQPTRTRKVKAKVVSLE